MFIVVSSPTAVLKEASFINQLFDEGLSVFHLRKPDYTEQEIVMLLKKINPKNYSKIALHNHHHLAEDFGIKRLHFTEASRRLIEINFIAHRSADNILSTSIHTIADYNNLLECFEYTFLGPVFDSISKPTYKALTEDKNVSHHKKRHTKLIALGGINSANCTLPFEWGFDGVAVLGALWNESNNMIEDFKKIQSTCAMIAQ
jgi:thiamine-phosphate pyrophosphorylase